MTAAERKSDVDLTTDTPYHPFTGELWGVSNDNLEENWPLYNRTELYLTVLFSFGNEYPL